MASTEQHKSNRKVALILASIALVFFAGVIIKQTVLS